MKTDILISIVVPVYNAEKYLEECLASLVNQTYKNTEIILVDDGSTDSSLKILKKYQKKYSSIKVISQKNQGSSFARSTGIKKAKGDYLMFVDADDWIDTNTISKLASILAKKQYDNIRFFGILEPSGIIKNQYEFQGKKQKELTKKEIYQLLIETKTLHNLCFGIYKTSLLKNIDSFESHVSFAEDYWANLDILTKASSVLMLNEVFYHYRENQASVTKKVEKERIIKNTEDAIFVYGKLFDYLKKWNIDNMENRIKVAFTILDVTRWSIFNIFKLKDIGKKETFELLKNIFDQEVFDDIRKSIPLKEVKKELKQKELIYRIKNSWNIKLIYKRKYHHLWINKYLFSIKY